jgi:glycopeptide antibiotics resistance protein
MNWIKARRAKIALGMYTVFLVALIIAADAGWLRRQLLLIHDVPLGDKAGHVILFGTLSFLINWVLRAARWSFGKFSVLKGSVLLMALAFLEELSQLCFRSRTFDWNDLLANALGIWFFGWLAQRILRRRSAARLA